jgi:hypothetical protein
MDFALGTWITGNQEKANRTGETDNQNSDTSDYQPSIGQS